MNQKAKLMEAAMKGLKVRPGATAPTSAAEAKKREASVRKPTSMRQPSEKRKPASAAKPAAGQAASSPPKSRTARPTGGGASASGMSFTPVELPPRESPPAADPNWRDTDAHNRYGWDFYIGYQQGIDDDAAKAVCDIIECV